MSAARWRPRLAAAIGRIADIAPAFDNEWWVIGSAAAAISGADVADVRDVDLLLGEEDARRLIDRWSAAPKSSAVPDDRFRSVVFARFEHASLAIEAFGGFEMKVRGVWRTVRPLTRVARGDVFTPSIAEQIALLEAMGRDKDRQRIAALRPLL